MITPVYRVQCSGPCRRWLSIPESYQPGDEIPHAALEPQPTAARAGMWPDETAARYAAFGAGWSGGTCPDCCAGVPVNKAQQDPAPGGEAKLPPPEGPEYTPCACSHIEPEHEPNAGECYSCDCEAYRPEAQRDLTQDGPPCIPDHSVPVYCPGCAAAVARPGQPETDVPEPR